MIEDALLEQIAGLLKIPVAAIKNFDEEAAIVYFNTFNDFKEDAHAIAQPNHCTFNPIDKIVELYEALLQSEREKVALLEKMLKK